MLIIVVIAGVGALIWAIARMRRHYREQFWFDVPYEVED